MCGRYVVPETPSGLLTFQGGAESGEGAPTPAAMTGGCPMARIEGVSRSQAGPVVKLAYRFGPRAMKKLTGRDPQAGNGIEPVEIWAHQPKMMMGMGMFNQAVRSGKSVDERIKNLVELKGAQMIG